MILAGPTSKTADQAQHTGPNELTGRIRQRRILSFGGSNGLLHHGKCLALEGVPLLSWEPSIEPEGSQETVRLVFLF